MLNFEKHLLKQGSSIHEALDRLNFLAIDAIVFIISEQGQLIGSLTDGDVRRGLLRGISLDQTVNTILQPHPHYIRNDEHNLQKIIEFRESNFRIIPIIDADDKVVNVINFRETKSYLPVDAVIMAGGRGKRLSPLTDNTPKSLLKIDGKPIIEYSIERLKYFGIDDFWICLNYLGNHIEQWCISNNERDINIHFIWEDKEKGTIGAISDIENFENMYILVANSDILTTIDYERFFLDFINQNADLSVATIPYSVEVPYAVLETSNGCIMNLKEKPTYTYYSNGGIYLLKKEVISEIPRGKHFNATDLIEKLISLGKNVISYPINAYWLDIGKHEDFEKAQKDVKNLNLK